MANIKLRKVAKIAVRIVEILSLPFIYVVALFIKAIRTIGFWRLPILRKAFQNVGVLPVADHYYEPLINPSRLRNPLSADRSLPGLDFNKDEQLALLNSLQFSDELTSFQNSGNTEIPQYRFNNIYFSGGDALYYYNIIRHFRPENIIEIGSGFSTLLALAAASQNEKEGVTPCKIQCIEPFENDWLEKTSAKIIRKRIEETDIHLFDTLKANDILFIDSSHVIRSQGDVLFEYFEILPQLASGVLVHIHDIFTPKDYPEDWLINDVRLWNEQYLVEAFLMMNTRFRIIGALNYQWHHHNDLFINQFPLLKNGYTFENRHHEPSSLWLIKN